MQPTRGNAIDRYWGWGRVFLTHVEETMELAGVVIFIYALLDYVRRFIRPIQVELSGAEPE